MYARALCRPRGCTSTASRWLSQRAWITAIASAFGGGWLTDAGSEAAFFAQVLRQVVRYSPRNAHYDSPGLVIIQLDGLSAPLLRFSSLLGCAADAESLDPIGQPPPSSTGTRGCPRQRPAASPGILHGAAQRVPAFRWYEKDTHRLHRRQPVGRRGRDRGPALRWQAGLLADGGVSISNGLLRATHPTSFLTFSRAFLPKSGASGYATFLSSPQGFSRAFVLTIGAMVTNLAAGTPSAAAPHHPPE